MSVYTSLQLCVRARRHNAMAATKLVIRDPLLSSPSLLPFSLSRALCVSFLSISCPPFLSLETVRRLDSCLPRVLSPCYRKFLSLSAKTFRHSVSFVVVGAARSPRKRRGVREAQRVSLVSGRALLPPVSARLAPRLGAVSAARARSGQ